MQAAPQAQCGQILQQAPQLLLPLYLAAPQACGPSLTLNASTESGRHGCLLQSRPAADTPRWRRWAWVGAHVLWHVLGEVLWSPVLEKLEVGVCLCMHSIHIYSLQRPNANAQDPVSEHEQRAREERVARQRARALAAQQQQEDEGVESRWPYKSRRGRVRPTSPPDFEARPPFQVCMGACLGLHS